MNNPKCIRCEGLKSCRDEQISWIIVIVGIISTVAIRVVTILMDINPLLGKIAWYVGISGFVVFFAYKYRVFKERARMIDQRNLMQKLKDRESLGEDDYKAISIMLCDIRSNKERVNYFFIFAASFVALIVAIYFDLIR